VERGGLIMRGDVNTEIKASSVSVKKVQGRNKKSLTKLKAGDSMTMNILGEDVPFKLVVVPPIQIEKRTMVFLENERDQDLLDEFSIADIAESYKEHGQKYPAIGRKTAGIIEVAEGSRRRFSSLHFQKQYFIWVGELTDEQMRHLSDLGNQYKGVSAYEKGLRYTRLLEQANNQEQVAKSLKMSRRMLMKYIDTASLPKTFIKCLPCPNDLSVNEGERLAKLYKKFPTADQVDVVVALDEWKEQKSEAQRTSDELIKMFTELLTKDKVINTPQKTELAMGAVMTVKNGNATIKIPKISNESREKIEEFISRTLSEEAIQ
jgi:ParB family chromosome partitioning protein